MWAQARLLAMLTALTFGPGLHLAHAQVGTPPTEAGQHGGGTGELSHQGTAPGSDTKVEPTTPSDKGHTKSSGKIESDTVQDTNQKPK